MKNLTLRLPDELHEMVAGAAADRGVSLNGMVCEILARGMTERGLRRALVETVRAEMRAEFEARRPPVVRDVLITENGLVTLDTVDGFKVPTSMHGQPI